MPLLGEYRINAGRIGKTGLWVASTIALALSASSVMAGERILKTPGATNALHLWPTSSNWIVGLVGDPSNKASLSCVLQTRNVNENGNGYYLLMLVWNRAVNHLVINDTDPNILESGTATVSIDSVDVLSAKGEMIAPDRSENRFAIDLDEFGYRRLVGLLSHGVTLKIATPKVDYGFDLNGVPEQLPNIRNCLSELNLLAPGSVTAANSSN